MSIPNRASNLRSDYIADRYRLPAVALAAQRQTVAGGAGLSPLTAANRPVTPVPTVVVAAAVAQPAVNAVVPQSPAYKTSPKNPTRRSLEPEEKLLDCPACFNEATPPFMQCSNGHLVSCNKCLPKIHICPTCRAPEPFARSLIEKTPFKCAYHTSGCMQKILGIDKMAHQRICLYRAISCILTGCEWSGGRGQFSQHLIDVHTVAQTASPTDLKLAKVQTVGPSLDSDLLPHQLCLISARGQEFLIITSFLSIPGGNDRRLRISATNLTTWQLYVAKTANFKAKFHWTDATGEFERIWVAQVDGANHPAVISEATFKASEMGTLQDSLLKVTIE